MIGGFGNLAGELDFWDLKSMKELGSTKQHCAVGIEWAPDGLTLMTAVLYERVKVDNLVQFYQANGDKVLTESVKVERLQFCSMKPYEEGAFKAPSLSKIQKKKVAAQTTSKRMFMYGGGNSAFAQAMRAEMGKTEDKGSKKLDQSQ